MWVTRMHGGAAHNCLRSPVGLVVRCKFQWATRVKRPSHIQTSRNGTPSRNGLTWRGVMYRRKRCTKGSPQRLLLLFIIIIVIIITAARSGLAVVAAALFRCPCRGLLLLLLQPQVCHRWVVCCACGNKQQHSMHGHNTDADILDWVPILVVGVCQYQVPGDNL